MKISIITACYCSAETIEQTIQSVLGQTYGDVEYIVVDGGSTDGTVGVVREYEAKFQGRMRWISEPDEGMYDAINKGIRMATGEVIGILNADDFLLDDGVLERMAQAFLHPSSDGKRVDAVYADIRFVKEAETLEALRNAQVLRYYSARRWKPWMLRWGYMPPHPGVYIRRDAYEQFGVYKLGYHIAADYELVIRFLRKNGVSMRYLDVCAVGMRIGGKSTKNWKSTLLLNREIARGNRENGYFCYLPMLVPKYLFKIFEFIVPMTRHILRDRKGGGTCGLC